MILIAAQIAVSLVVGLAVLGMVIALFGQPAKTEPPVSRLIADRFGQAPKTAFDQPLFLPFLTIGLQIAKRLTAPALRKRVRQDLNAAGNPNGYSIQEQLAICTAWSFAGLLLALGIEIFALTTQSGQIATSNKSLLSALFTHGLLFTAPAFCFLGFFLPLAALKSAAKRRCDRIAKQLPYAMDLIALTMAAGSSFNEAVETLIQDDPNDDLNIELGLVLSEIKFGTTRTLALTNMADRIPLESLRSIVGAIVQAESLGTPLSTILKLQADMLRNRRSVRAEKLSASASLRLLVPTMLILAAVVLIVFGPFVVKWLQGDLLF